MSKQVSTQYTYRSGLKTGVCCTLEQALAITLDYALCIYRHIHSKFMVMSYNIYSVYTHLVVAEGRVMLDDVHVTLGDHRVAISVQGVQVIDVILACIHTCTIPVYGK